ncbi:MAG: hypothetical protein ACSHWQ_03135 [Spongiibacteraceae bacterium]
MTARYLITNKSPEFPLDDWKIILVSDLASVRQRVEAVLDLAQYKKNILATTCLETARVFGLRYFTGEEFIDAAKTDALDSLSQQEEVEAFISQVKDRAVKSVKAEDWSGIKVRTLPKGANFMAYKDEIAADPSSVKILCGPTGSGKTTFSDYLCKEVEAAGGKFYYYSLTRSVVKAQKIKMEDAGIALGHYEHLEIGDFTSPKSGVSTTHSMHRARIKEASAGASLKVVDEYAGALRSMANFKGLKNKIAAVEAMFSVVSDATPKKQALIMDAGFSQQEVDLIRQARPDGDITVYLIPRDYSHISVTIHPQKSAIIQRFVQTGRKIVAVDCKKTAKIFDFLGNKLGYKGLLITADTQEGEKQQEFIQNPDLALKTEQYDYVIYTPVYFRYGSIETDYFDRVLALSCGAVTPEVFIQGIRRWRPGIVIDLAFAQASKRGTWRAQWSDDATDRVISAINAQDDFLSEEIKTALPAALGALGFQVVYADALRYRDNREMVSLLAEAKKSVKELGDFLINEVNDIGTKEALSRLGRSDCTDKEQAEMHRRLCIDTTGEKPENSPAALAFYNEGSGLKRLRLLETARLDSDECLIKDKTEIARGVDTVSRGHFAAKKRDLGLVLNVISKESFGLFDFFPIMEKLAESKEWPHFGLKRVPEKLTDRSASGFFLAVVRELGFRVERTGGKNDGYRVVNHDQVEQYYKAWLKSKAGDKHSADIIDLGASNKTVNERLSALNS